MILSQMIIGNKEMKAREFTLGIEIERDHSDCVLSEFSL